MKEENLLQKRKKETKKCLKYSKKIAKILLSRIGLCVLAAVYVLVGGYIFVLIEDSDDVEESDKKKWTLARSLFYCVTIVTTIGKF